MALRDHVGIDFFSVKVGFHFATLQLSWTKKISRPTLTENPDATGCEKNAGRRIRNMDDFSIQYQGFTPTPVTRTYIQELMFRAHEGAPSASCLRVTISRTGRNSYKGILRISSSAGSFFSIASEQTPLAVAHQLLDRVRRQLDKWKSRRFPHETIRRTPSWGGRNGNEPRAG